MIILQIKKVWRDLDVKFNKLILITIKMIRMIKGVKIDKKSSILKKGVFTSCSDEHDCPP